jgi:hypothetical protein
MQVAAAPTGAMVVSSAENLAKAWLAPQVSEITFLRLRITGPCSHNEDQGLVAVSLDAGRVAAGLSRCC